MDIEIGSNLYRNSNGIIEVDGVPQIEVARHPSSGALLVNFALFDSNGRLLAKMVDSTMMFNERRAYELTKTNQSVAMKDTESGKILLHVEVKAVDLVSLSRGEFHTMKGRLLHVSPTEWKIEKQQTSGLTQNADGGAVSIG
ncbi:MAG TPA: hypothetical protein VFU48_08455 [Nitrospira sp.]|nr:hypothetical protein [Nitrospira sp.]